jgi:glycosyltransferase involved in cell wall biosynthesis
MEYLKNNTDWELRIIVRIAGTDLGLYDNFDYNKVFYHHCMPEKAKKIYLPIATHFIDQFIRVLKLQLSPRNAYRSMKEQLRKNKIVNTQKRWESEIKEEIQYWKPDVVYSNTAVNGDVIKRIGVEGIPVFVHVRELAASFATLNEEQIDEFRNRPQHYLPVSEFVRDYLVAEHGVPVEKTCVVPVGLKSDMIYEKAEEESYEEIRKKYLQKHGEDVLILAVGYLNERKGPDIFLDVAFDVLADKELAKHVRFMWVGDGPWMKKMRNQVKEAGLENEVYFVGLKENPYPYIQACDFLLMTSRDDPFPRVNLEAALFERPIICFADSGGSKEFARDDCGVIVPGIDVAAMKERTKELIKDSALRQRLGANAKSKVLNNYQMDMVGKKIKGILEDKVIHESQEN